MSDFLYYCSKCNSLVADTYDDDEIACEQCGGRMTPLHIDEDEWDEMNNDEKISFLEKYRNPQPQVQKRRPVATSSSQAGRAYGGTTSQRAKRVSSSQSQQQYYSQPSNTKDYYDKTSGMSIAAFVLSLLGCTSIVGLILGIIDLTKNDGRKRGLSIAAVVISGILLLGSGVYSMTKSDSKSEKIVDNTPTVSESVETPEVEETTLAEDDAPEPEPEPVVEEVEEPEEASQTQYNISVASNSGDMHLKDIGERNGLYIGLNYVKRMDYLPLALDQKEEVDPSHEVIIPFVEVFNGASKKQNFRADKFTCYVDGTQVDKVDTYMLTDIDGVHAIGGSYDLEPETMALLTRNFEVPRDWSELKLFYDDGCIWTLSSSEVSTEPFNKESLFNLDINRSVTPEGEVIYDDEYKVTYKGFEEYTKDSIFGPQDYAIVKLTIENTGDKMLDFGLVGYNMRGYNNNYLMDSPNYTLDDKLGSFINIHNVESVQIGMSTDAYVAFEIEEPVNDFYFVYDTGYIIDKALGSVYYKK